MESLASTTTVDEPVTVLADPISISHRDIESEVRFHSIPPVFTANYSATQLKRWSMRSPLYSDSGSDQAASDAEPDSDRDV